MAFSLEKIFACERSDTARGGVSYPLASTSGPSNKAWGKTWGFQTLVAIAASVSRSAPLAMGAVYDTARAMHAFVYARRRYGNLVEAVSLCVPRVAFSRGGSRPCLEKTVRKARNT
jgi:hypothetical protein